MVREACSCWRWQISNKILQSAPSLLLPSPLQQLSPPSPSSGFCRTWQQEVVASVQEASAAAWKRTTGHLRESPQPHLVQFAASLQPTSHKPHHPSRPPFKWVTCTPNPCLHKRDCFCGWVQASHSLHSLIENHPKSITRAYSSRHKLCSFFLIQSHSPSWGFLLFCMHVLQLRPTLYNLSSLHISQVQTGIYLSYCHSLPVPAQAMSLYHGLF